MLEVHDPKLGRLRLRLWQNFHFQQSALHPMHLIQVEHLDEFGGQKSKPLWLTWLGIEMPALFDFWRLYLRRFAIDHWYRFALATPTLDFTQTEYPRTV